MTKPPVVVTSPAVEIPVAPVKFTAPSDVISPAPAMVRPAVSAFRVTIPALVVVIVLFTVIAWLTILTPAAALVLTAPLSVVKPLPSTCTRLAAVIELVAVTLAALLMVIAPKRVVADAPPTAPVKVISPAVPAVIPKVLAFASLSKVPLNDTAAPVKTPPAFVVSTVVLSFRTVLPAKVMADPALT